MLTERFNFPGGEVHIRLKDWEVSPTNCPVRLTAPVYNSDDVMALLLQTDALRRAGCSDIDLVLPYVPYARQDRVMVPGEPLSVKVFCDLINSQNYRSVEILDPHSDVAPALLNNCTVVPQHLLVKCTMPDQQSTTVLVCPDAGARKKIHQVAKTLGLASIVYADKLRDVETGKISKTVLSSVPSEWDKGVDHVIVDDIADGGATFIELAKLLRASGVTGKIILYVTHGIFSKGFEPFEGVIDEIYTVHTWRSEEELASVNQRAKLTVSVGWHLVVPV